MPNSKYFGEFLVSHGVLNKSQLLEALIIQIESSSSLQRLFFERKLLSDDDFLEVLKLQFREGIDFRSAIDRNGLWQHHFDDILKTSEHGSHPPLGHILVNKGFVDFKKLSEYFDNYLESLSDEQGGTGSPDPEPVAQAKPPAPKDDAAAEKPAPASDEASAAADDYVPVFTVVDPKIVRDYIELLDEQLKSSLEQKILYWEVFSEQSDIGQLEESLKCIYRDYHSIKGSARFIGAELTERVIHAAEELLGFVQQFLKDISASDFEKMTNYNLLLLDVIWALKDSIVRSSSEESFWQDQTSQDQYQELHANLKSLYTDFTSRGLKVNLDDIKDEF